MTEKSVGADPLRQLAAAVTNQSTLIDGDIDSVTGQVMPPIERWNPPFCGDIDLEIRADGSWWHEGSAIKRRELVRLFASIMYRDEEGSYYLVTPVEKVRIRVALHPLMVVDAEPVLGSSPETLMLTLNTGGHIPLDARHPLATEPRAADAAYVQLSRGLTALFSRPAWYRLVDRIDDSGAIHSAGERFLLSS